MSDDWVGGVLGAGDLVSCVQVVWMEVRVSVEVKVRMELMMRSVAEGGAGRRHLQDTAHHATDSGHTQLDVPGHAG